MNGTKASTAMTSVQMCGFSTDDVLMFVERTHSFKFAFVKATGRKVLESNGDWIRRWIGVHGRRWGWIGVGQGRYSVVILFGIAVKVV